MKINEKNIKKPEYYNHGVYEPWKIIDYYKLDYYLGSALVYILRNGRKSKDNSDIIKAISFLEHYLELQKDETKWAKFSL